MVAVYDMDKKDRQMQNYTARLMIFTAIFGTATYLSVCLTVLATSGWQQVLVLVKTPLQEQLQHIKQFEIYYWTWWWAHRQEVGLFGQDFISLKLFIPTCGPYLVALIITAIYGKQIIELQVVKKDASLYGDAHWAEEWEIKKAGLRAKKGVLLGADKEGKYITADGYQHILLFAPTGAGKGVGFVIPNLLFWEESVVCHDIKLENYDLTSGWRNKHFNQSVYVWEPANPDGRTHAYNPIDWVSPKPGVMVDDVQKFSNLILQKKEFWENEARTLLVGVILGLIADTSKVKSFGEVVRTLRGDDFAYSMAVVLDTLGDVIHPVGYMNLAAFMQKADKERSGVVSTLNSGLELWANPLIDAATGKSDFDVNTFRRIATTVFVGLTPDNIQRLKSLMAMFYQQSTDFLSKKMPQKDEPFGVLYLMDEFPTVGKLEQFLAGIAYFRGYHVRLFLIVQDTQQLKGTYEDAGMNSFLSNSTYRVTFAANNIETARLISDLCGNQTVESVSSSRAKFFQMNPQSSSANVSASSRALLLPQEVIALPRDEQIILIEAQPPIRSNKIFYYKDKMFTSRLIEKVPLPIQVPIEVKRPKPAEKHEDGEYEENQAPQGAIAG